MSNPPIDFESAEFALRQSWETHRQAFGPILEPAFAENPQVRIMLINALNHISRREVKRGMELLKELHPHCIYDEDKAAWAFFVGLCFEMGGARAQMLEWYEKAGQIGHRFYLPYLKLAKAAHSVADFEKAKGYYKTAIECLLEMEDPDEIILGSAYTNLTSCYTMLHQYPAADAAWTAAQKYPLQPGADATAAILYAAMGNEEKVEAHIRRLQEKCPAWVGQTREMTGQILRGVHPAFPTKP
jgi:tetratricopeptide (TPR) repeat protein